MLRGSRKYWFIAIVFGLLTAILAYKYLHNLKASYSPSELVKVVAASSYIKKDSVIDSKQIKIIELPATYAHPLALHKEETVIGKIALADISAGEHILSSKLLTTNDMKKRLSYAVPKGKRAVSVAINDVSGVAGYIEPGDRVDVVATVDIPVEGQSQSRTYTMLNLQNIQVLAIGENLKLVDDKKNSTNKTITLAVGADESLPLVLASERGSIRMLLRSPADTTKNGALPYQLHDLLTAPVQP